MYKKLLKPYFFSLSPEKAHYRAINLFDTAMKLPGGKSIINQLYNYQDPSLEREVCGLKFKNPVGLAAGFDKDGKFYHQMAKLGFGFIEIGTVTPLPQAGNPQPRLFRLPSDRALINRMGFNNDGVDAMVARIKKMGKPQGTILGGNIGKNKVTPNDKAVDDYVTCFKKLRKHVDYFVVNVSSPNTPGLRELQDKKPLTHILSTLKDLNASRGKKRPIFLKIAPDLTRKQLDDIVDIVQDTQIEGLIATNTTTNRSGLTTSADELSEIGNGGLSGAPIQKKSNSVITHLRKKLPADFPIIGVGGIDSPEEAEKKLKKGSTLIQVYTGFIYEGPGLIKRINQHLSS